MSTSAVLVAGCRRTGRTVIGGPRLFFFKAMSRQETRLNTLGGWFLKEAVEQAEGRGGQGTDESTGLGPPMRVLSGNCFVCHVLLDEF